MKPIHWFVISLMIVIIATTFCFHVVKKADIFYYQAHQFFVKQRYHEAISLYLQSLRISPAFLKALREIAFCYQWTRQYPEATEYFKKALQKTPHDIALQKALAETFSWNRQYPQAIEVYERILMQKDIPLVRMLLAEAYLYDAQYTKAQELLEHFLRSFPDNEQALLLLAEVFYFSGNTQKATPLYERLLNAYKGKGKRKIEESLSLLYSIQKQYAKAEYLYTRLLQKDPKNSKLRLRYADVLSWQQRFKEAASEYEKVIALNPYIRGVEEKLAEVLMWDHQYAKAEQIYTILLQKEPYHCKARIQYADVLSWQQRFKEAASEYEKVIALNPQSKGVYEKLAKVYAWDHQYQKAEQILISRIQEGYDTEKTRLLLVEIFIWDKDYARASSYLAPLMNKSETPSSKVMLLYGQTLLYTFHYEDAIALFQRMLQREPLSYEAKMYLADAYAYSNRFAHAISLYEEIVACPSLKDIVLPNFSLRQVERKLADVLSWDRQYDKALAWYDRLLSEQEDMRIHLQKARVLGWAHRYKESLQKYKKIVELYKNESIATEMRAKKAYWNGRVLSATQEYNTLIVQAPDNTEARFDLGQIYSYRALWDQARQQMEAIRASAPGHFRAQQTLEKIDLVSTHPSLETGYQFFEADSTGRIDDIRAHTWANRVQYPLPHGMRISLHNNTTYRMFADFPDICEDTVGARMEMRAQNTIWGEGFYQAVLFNRGISTLHELGSTVNMRVQDPLTCALSYEREHLFNISKVIRERYYRDNYRGRIMLDADMRLKIKLSDAYLHYSDHNRCHEPQWEVLYYLSLDPKRFTIRYQGLYRSFSKEKTEYFSPQHFWQNLLALNWRHFLNKEEIFWGADDLFYDLKYEVGLDSQHIVNHTFSTGLYWDITKRLNVNIEGSMTHTSAKVYREKRIQSSIKYYF